MDVDELPDWRRIGELDRVDVGDTAVELAVEAVGDPSGTVACLKENFSNMTLPVSASTSTGSQILRSPWLIAKTEKARNPTKGRVT